MISLTIRSLKGSLELPLPDGMSIAALKDLLHEKRVLGDLHVPEAASQRLVSVQQQARACPALVDVGLAHAALVRGPRGPEAAWTDLRGAPCRMGCDALCT